MINKVNHLFLLLLLGGGLSFFSDSCTKEMTESSVVSDEIEVTKELETEGVFLEKSPADYIVSREMVEAYVRDEVGDRQDLFTIDAHPSENNPLLYVVNYEEGWKIIPGDSRFGLVLAESSKGHVDLSVESENPGFNLWIGNYKDQIEHARVEQRCDANIEDNVRAWENYKARHAMLLTQTIIDDQRDRPSRELMWAKINYSLISESDTLADVGPYLQTKWGQNTPWNTSMPEMNNQTCKVGCAPVAVAQVLFFFHFQRNYPSGLYHSISIANQIDYSINNRDWCEVTLNRSNFTYNSTHWADMPLTGSENNPTGYQYVSDFLLDVGARLGAEYGTQETRVNADNNGYYNTAASKVYGTWRNYSAPYTVNTIVNSLNAETPVIVGSVGQSGAHTWVIDGYLKEQITRTKRYEWWPVNMIPPGTVVYEYKTTSELLAQYNNNIYQGMPVYEPDGVFTFVKYRMNWGYDGLYDDALYSETLTSSQTWNGYYYNTVIEHSLYPGEFTY